MHHQYFSPVLLDRLGKVTDRRAYTAGVAFAIAGCLQLPPAPVESPETYFQENLNELATKGITIFNEVRLLDWADAVTLSRQAWLARYMAVYSFKENMIAYGVSNEPNLLDLFGIGIVIPVDTVCYLKDNTEAVACVVKTAVEAIHTHNLI